MHADLVCLSSLGRGQINEFLATFDMDLICRAHMVVEDGYEFWNERTLVTVFSAPNYCGECVEASRRPSDHIETRC